MCFLNHIVNVVGPGQIIDEICTWELVAADQLHINIVDADWDKYFTPFTEVSDQLLCFPDIESHSKVRLNFLVKSCLFNDLHFKGSTFQLM